MNIGGKKGLALILLVALCLSCAACQATAIVPETAAAQETAAPYGAEDLTGCWVTEMPEKNSYEASFFAVQFLSNGEWVCTNVNKSGKHKQRGFEFYCRNGLSFYEQTGSYYTEKGGTLLLKDVQGTDKCVLDYKREGDKLVMSTDATTYEFTLWDKNISHLCEYGKAG